MLSPLMKISVTRSMAAIAVVIFVTGALGFWSDFYLLRMFIMVSCVFLALTCFGQQLWTWGVGALFLSIFFNPIVPIINLPRHLWVTLDLIAAVGVTYFAIWATNPYWKGTRFEQYVSTLFPTSDFVIQDRTRDISKFSKRYVESDGHPDFVFRSKKTGQVFAVECKWRGAWAKSTSGELGLWWKKEQGARYQKYATDSGIPVFIAIFICLTPHKP